MIKELKILNDIYSAPDSKGNQKLIKADVVTRMLINTEDIRYVEEVITVKAKSAKIIPGVCTIKVDNENFKIQHSFEEIKELVNHKEATVVGFKIPTRDDIRGARKVSPKTRKHGLSKTTKSRSQVDSVGGSNNGLLTDIQGDGAESSE